MRANPHFLMLCVVLALPTSVFCQQEKSAWKEYRSAADGFELTVPSLPTPHNSPALPGATAYVIPIRGTSTGVVLKVKKASADCGSIISALKERVPSDKKSAVDPSSVKELSIEGYPGFEYRWKPSGVYTTLERWYCVDARLYIFSVPWPSTQPFPTEATIILDSFRLLPKEQPSH